MKPHHDFTPERTIAQHCQELFSPADAVDDRSEQQAADLAAFTAQLQKAVQSKLAAHLGRDSLKVACEKAATSRAEILFKDIGDVAANVLLECGIAKLPLLLSFDYGAALALTEQAFGGDVRSIESGLTELPASAWLVLEKIALQIARSIVEAGEIDCNSKEPCAIVRSHENVTKLDAFAKQTSWLVWPTKLRLSADIELPFRLAMNEEMLADVIHTPVKAAVAGNSSAHFQQLPLPMRVVLADLPVSVARLASLKPGDCIPFSPNNEVPLMTGSRVVATGRIGALGSSIALNITHIS